MDRAKVNGIELEYEVRGAGKPVLLIDMLIADCFLPLLTEPALAHRYQLIRYHKRGWVGSTHTPPPVSIGEHAADAAALLDHVGVRRAHIAGHSTGASIGAQPALDHPEKVHTLTLLEPTLVSLPLGGAFLKAAGPVFEAYGSGDHSGAIAMFVAAASGLDWETCRALLEERIPGVVTQSVKDADTFFGLELPALTEWTFGPEQAAAIRRPVLSVIGAETQPLWLEIAAFLRSSLPQVEELTVEGAGHLLHIQRPEPVARAWRSFWSEARSPAIRCWSDRELDPPAAREGAARGPCGDPVIARPERWRGLVTDVTITLCPGPT
jgi:pimeloyl-ACP methyl ester carboxylesterase